MSAVAETQSELEYLQQTMEYRTSADLYPHNPPHDRAREWNKTLLEIAGKDRFGDQRLRIVWAGREMRRGIIYKDGQPHQSWVIKYPAEIGSRCRQISGYKYLDKNGKIQKVKNYADIPEGTSIIEPTFDYYWLGRLRWALEMKMTPEELVAMGYPEPGSSAEKRWVKETNRAGQSFRVPMDERGEYLKMYFLETLPDHKYFEPTREWFESLRAAQYDVRNSTPESRDKALAAWEAEQHAAEASEASEQYDAEQTFKEEVLIEAEKEPVGLVTFDYGKK